MFVGSRASGHGIYERLTAPSPKELGGVQHSSSFQKVQNNDVEANTIKDTQKSSKGSFNRINPGHCLGFKKILTKSKQDQRINIVDEDSST